jgi:hypothetical protein
VGDSGASAGGGGGGRMGRVEKSMGGGGGSESLSEPTLESGEADDWWSSLTARRLSGTFKVLAAEEEADGWELVDGRSSPSPSSSDSSTSDSTVAVHTSSKCLRHAPPGSYLLGSSNTAPTHKITPSNDAKSSRKPGKPNEIKLELKLTLVGSNLEPSLDSISFFSLLLLLDAEPLPPLPLALPPPLPPAAALAPLPAALVTADTTGATRRCTAPSSIHNSRK